MMLFIGAASGGAKREKNMDGYYIQDWAKGKKEEMLKDFQITEQDIAGCEILLAAYLYEDYEGSAFVLFRKDGDLYEVNGSHCSCYGLEGQWHPEETSKEYLAKKLAENFYDFRPFRGAIEVVLQGL